MEVPVINDGDTIVLDTETNGLDWKTCFTCGFVITVEREGNPISYYYPIRHEIGPNLPINKVLDWIKSWADKRIHIIGHNLKFDLHFCANDGIYFPNATFEDTQINACLIDENSRSFSLDAQCRKMGTPAKKGEELYKHLAEKFGGKPDRNQMGNYWRLPADDFLAVDYAVGDGDSTYYLQKAQIEMIKLQELERVWQLECRVLPTLFRMERRGVKVNTEQLDKLKNWIDKEIKLAESQLPWEGFNVRGRADLPKAFKQVGITNWPVTPKGNPSFTEDWLLTNDLGSAIVKVRKLTNLMNTFVTGAVESNLYNGKVHCSFNQLRGDEYGTITGRLSSSQPNMQQVPKRDKLLAPIFRSIFMADDGNFWSSNDYSQQEWRLFAAYVQKYLNGGQQLVKAYQSGIDVHDVVAQMTGLDRDTKAKRLNMGMLNWMGAPKVMKEIGVSEAEAKAILDQYHSKFPVVRKFLKRCQSKINNRGYITTILGRRARFEDRGFSYRGASRVIQGGCADLTKEKLVEVDEFLVREAGQEHGILLQVHDSLDWVLPDTKLGREIDEEAIRIMGDYSNHPVLVVPMKVDHGEGNNWGEASFSNVDWNKYG